MIETICRYLRNWFDEDDNHNRLPYWEGEFSIVGGELVGFSDKLLDGQYFRIIGSSLNDAVYQFPVSGLDDETFIGTIQSMRLPKMVISKSAEIDAWRAKYNTIDSVAMSPFSSENFGGYGYSKPVQSSNTSANIVGWESIFGKDLAPWRKI